MHPFEWFLAAVPILIVLGLMLGLRWQGSRSGPVAWVAALLIAALRFGAGWDVLVWAQLKGILLALWVLYIIWAALLLFRVTDEAGATDAIGGSLARLTVDPAMQALLVGWIFATFLQGFGGFGVPVAVTAPLLVGAGFTPVTSVLIASVGSSWGVTYGTLGAAFYALLAATGYPGEALALPLAAMMAVACLLCGFAALWAAGGARGMRRLAAFVLILSLVMGGIQVAAAWAGLWTIGVLCAGLAGLGVGVLWARSGDPARATGVSRPVPAAARGVPGSGGTRIFESAHNPSLPLSLTWALVPYGLLIAVVLITDLVPSVDAFLGQVVFQVRTPEVMTARGWITPAGAARAVNLFGSPGAILLYLSFLTYLLYRHQGFYAPHAARRIGAKVLKQGIPTSIGIITMMAMAMTMQDAGMTTLLAEGVSRAAGPAFPLISVFVGAFGAFMTGSNANSAVLFGRLQEEAALLIGMSPVLALTAQGLGGALGGIFAPAKVMLGSAPVGADEGTAMRRTMAYGVAILGVLALAIWAISLTS